MIMKSLKPILPIVIFTALLNLFFVSGEGEPLVHIWFLTIYAEGVRYAVLMAVRVMALIAGTSLLTYTTSPSCSRMHRAAAQALGQTALPGARAGDDDEHCPAVHPHPH